ncbi:MAC/perforin family protein [Chlamydia felis Fe/C-56]|uniref:MAC/perforin family protein n=1 Tax=Chlamydia felis (strain Fe/C-56) TaxID=264202 RepID=Q254S1_CHLFF|nr:MAC/perforin family protein [Chlamydia felis Fe/C-56]
MVSPASPVRVYDLREGSRSCSNEIQVSREQLFPGYSSKVSDIAKAHKRDAKILVNRMTYSNIWRNKAKSQILTEGEVRLDLQGCDGTKYNYQLQVGNYTIATVLINRNIAHIRSLAEQVYATRKIKSGFQKSLHDSHIYHVSFKSSISGKSSTTTDKDKSVSSSKL